MTRISPQLVPAIGNEFRQNMPLLCLSFPTGKQIQHDSPFHFLGQLADSSICVTMSENKYELWRNILTARCGEMLTQEWWKAKCWSVSKPRSSKHWDAIDVVCCEVQCLLDLLSTGSAETSFFSLERRLKGVCECVCVLLRSKQGLLFFPCAISVVCVTHTWVSDARGWDKMQPGSS